MGGGLEVTSDFDSVDLPMKFASEAFVAQAFDRSLKRRRQAVTGQARGWVRTARALVWSKTQAFGDMTARGALHYREGTTDIIESGPTDIELAQISQLLKRRLAKRRR